MALALRQVLPNLSTHGIAKTGFIFGAGTSHEAGYPLMPQLTQEAVGALHSAQRADLDEVLAGHGKSYDAADGSPNIEIIADQVKAYEINSGDPRFANLSASLRQHVIEIILGIADPKIDHHVRFLQSLKKLAFSQAKSVYIFTTNYDILFELAGVAAGVFVETGFVGSVERFFDQARFATLCGRLVKQHFAEHPVLTVRLIKLHGSTSWVSRNGLIVETNPAVIPIGAQRVMVLPRRGKVMETLQPPHDSLFSLSSRILGADCQYLASCGFSFGDDHINEHLIMPALKGGRASLFAFGTAETAGMAAMKSLPNFSAGFEAGGLRAGSPHTEGTDCWKFSRFVDLFG